MVDVQNIADNAQDKIANAIDDSAIPTPSDFHEQASVHELKSRLDWGEPALTILDVRSPEAFRQRRVLGAVSLPLDGMRQQVQLNVEPNRDLYVYGADDAETTEAAQKLRQSGYQRVAELQGSLSAWEQAGGSIEGITAGEDAPSAGSFNVANRVQEFAEEQRNNG